MTNIEYNMQFKKADLGITKGCAAAWYADNIRVAGEAHSGDLVELVKSLVINGRIYSFEISLAKIEDWDQ